MRIRKVLARRRVVPGYCDKSAANFARALSRKRHGGRLSLAWQMAPPVKKSADVSHDRAFAHVLKA